jgi:hypothetical protein
MQKVPMWRRLLLAAVLSVAGVAAVAAAVGLGSANPTAVFAADPTAIPGHPDLGNGWMAPHGWQFGGGSNVAITITAINGNSLSLKTTDGWTRTIDATGATITKAGQTTSVSSLKVGDEITFREARQSDGTYKITTIAVVVPTVTGTVSAVTSSSVTITLAGGSSQTLALTSATAYTQGGATVTHAALVVGIRIQAQGMVDTSGNFTATSIAIAPSTVTGTVASKTTTTIAVTTASGKTVTVNVGSSTTYEIRGVSGATLASVAVGDRIAADGTLNADGSLTATMVQAAANDRPGFGGFGGGFGRGSGRGFGHGFGGSPGTGGAGASPSPSAGSGV